jgi:periplasmic divalent cation tolerance protein
MLPMSSPATADVHVAFCTCPDAEVAEQIAGALVQGHLAACASVVPGVVSVYRWQGQIQRDAEALLMIKTTGAQLEALTARICALHPYDLPEVIAHPITAGHTSYLDWVRQCTITHT